MNTDSKKTRWIKWSIATVIALIGAAGGVIAVLEYLDNKRAKEQRAYAQAVAKWEAFTPPQIGENERVELSGYIDLDTGLVAMSLTGSKWDLRFELDLIVREQGGRKRAVGTKWEGLRVNENVQWVHVGVKDFNSVSYRDIRDASFKKGGWIYRAHPTAAPGPGYIFAVKTSQGNVAKLQIVEYKPHNSYSRKMFLRYEVYPIVADPPRPRRP